MKTMLILAGLTMGFMAGCDLSSYCDPGQVYKDFSCYDPPPDASIPPTTMDAPVTTDMEGSEANSCKLYEGFGDTCTDVSQCRCGLDSCNTYMNANYCTHTGCLENPSVCPTTWTCIDLAAFGGGSACLRP